MSNFTVGFGRTDRTANKFLSFRRRAKAIEVANAIAFVLWGVHAFKRSDCRLAARHEANGHWVEFVADTDDDLEPAH